MDNNLFNILVCPSCNGRLEYIKQKELLLCKFDCLAYPIKNGIPVLLTEKANLLTSAEVDAINE